MIDELDRVCCWKDLLARRPPTQWRVKRLLAAAVAEGRAGGFLGARCSVAHREFSGISHIRFSMGVSAKVAALHTVERDPFARASCSHAALPSKRCAAQLRRSLSNGRGRSSRDLADFPTDSYVPYVVNDFSEVSFVHRLADGERSPRS
jgi:hypothetical protein